MTSPPSELFRLLFRLRAAQIRQGVDLRGDMIHWHEPVPLLRRAGVGWFEAELELPPGVYRYKFHTTDDEWLLDPANVRTCARGGAQNSLLVVGGTDEPVMHAPVRPWLFLEDDGRVCLRAGLRIGQGEGLRVRWDEGHGARSARLRPVVVEGEHQLLETHLSASADQLRYLFELDDGRLVGASSAFGAELVVRLAELRATTPAWWRDSVVYTLFVDRFRLGGTGGGWLPRPELGAERERAGGDLRGVIEALPYLTRLGVTALHLTPIVVARSAHRYDAVEPRRVDDALGGDALLRELVREAHALGLRVVLDVTLTHVHRDFFAFRDVRSRGPRSPYWEWFRIFAFPFREGYEPGYDHYQRGQWEEPVLRTEHPGVMAYLVETLEHWTRFGVDGFRIDAAADVPLALLRRLRSAVRAINPEVVLFGELTVDNAARFTTNALDAATDFVSQQALYDWLWRRKTGAADYASAVRAHRFLQTGPGWTAIGLTATHDQPRLRTLVEDPAVARIGHLLGLTGAAVPALYYGDEIGLSSGEPGRNFEDAWPDRCPMPWDSADWDRETLALFRRAIRARRQSAALRRGDERFLPLRSLPERDDDARDLLCLRRTDGDEVVDVLVNASAAARVVGLPGSAPAGAEVLCAAGECAVRADEGRAALGAWSALVARRVPTAEAARAANELVAEGRRIGWLAFREGATEALALPAQLYLTVTEACNLGCRHCLNHSPDRTSAGTAREIRPWLIGRLGEAFAAADYLAFSHGGESLLSPMLWPVLDAMAERHRGRAGRYDVHLLSNGMLLDGERLRRLLERGVTSLAVSLDGARAETNDAIRVGGSLATVLDHLREAVALRDSERADLRIGVSTVVCEANVAELPALGALALELGLDWLKLEELVPATPWAREHALDPGDGRLREALAGLRERVAGHSLVLVDHLEPPTGCRCQAAADPRLRAFRESDDFANRTRFNPCRAAWEQACIDPDGLVHPVDYHQPPVGGLLEQSMLELWDGEPMRREREVALRRFPEVLRQRCPNGP